MHRIKKIGLAVGVIFIGIQFIQPIHNKVDQILAADITKTIRVPDTVLAVLENSCYDCHSNNTNYPWYVNIQPVGWIMANHIKQGKAVLNFSEFGNYSSRKQFSKLSGIANSIKDNVMPISSYQWMHKNARLTTDEKAIILNWVQQSKDAKTLM